ncbi:MAG: RNA methyltransferase [Verrucomicrobia bacterium]|nr:RNA methyltransferase [Verrucomicrobiota bacterium]
MLTKAELQRLRSLREKKHREALGLFVVEGEKVVGELLAAGFPLLELYATEDWLPPSRAASAAAAETPTPSPSLVRVSPAEMARASHFPTPSNVLAVGRIARPPLHPPDLARGLTLALDGLQDPGNVGTLLRIADWFAFERVLLSPDCADLFHQKVINASMGSFARVRTHVVGLPAVLSNLRAAHPDLPILGCDLAGEPLATVPILAAAVVVVGSEGQGLSPAVAACLSRRVTIPRLGAAESLNAAVAAGIVCAHLRRSA